MKDTEEKLFPVIVSSYRLNETYYRYRDDCGNIDTKFELKKINSKKELIEHIAKLNIEAWLEYYSLRDCPFSENDTFYYYFHIICDKYSFDEQELNYYFEDGDSTDIHFPSSWTNNPSYVEENFTENIREEVNKFQSKIVEDRKKKLRDEAEEKYRKKKEEERVSTELIAKQKEEKERLEYIRLKKKYEESNE